MQEPEHARPGADQQAVDSTGKAAGAAADGHGTGRLQPDPQKQEKVSSEAGGVDGRQGVAADAAEAGAGEAEKASAVALQHQVQLSSTVLVHHFISLAVSLAEHCGNVYSQAYAVMALRSQDTAQRDPGLLLAAAATAQKTIEACVRAYYPKLRVRGPVSRRRMQGVRTLLDPEAICLETISMTMLNEKKK